MSVLPDSYTQYPCRREGYDHDLYDWSNMHARPSLTGTVIQGNRFVMQPSSRDTNSLLIKIICGQGGLPAPNVSRRHDIGTV